MELDTGFRFVWPTGLHTLRGVVYLKSGASLLPDTGDIEAMIIWGMIDEIRGISRLYTGTFIRKGKWLHLYVDDGKRPRLREKQTFKISISMGKA